MRERGLARAVEAPESTEGGPTDGVELTSLLRDLFRLDESDPVPDPLGAAQARAVALSTAAGPGDEARHLALLALAADGLVALWLDRPWDARRIKRLIGRLASETGLEADVVRLSLFLEAVRGRLLFELPPKLAVEAQLSMLVSFAPVSGASLWTSSDSGRLACALRDPAEPPTRRTRAAAQTAIETGSPVSRERAYVHALPIRSLGGPRAALVFRARPDDRDEATTYGMEAALAMAPLLPVVALLERNAEHERALVDSSERRLVRVSFDLHDGPMQEIAALAQDVRFFRSQLARVVADAHERTLLVGRVDDLEARLSAVDRELRELAQSLHSPTALRLGLADLIEREMDTLRQQSSIRASLRTTGDLEALTASQKIALHRVVQEALTNVRDHSGAKHVEVHVSARRARLSAEVVDDGVGFDVETRLVEAARAGHLGLVGMGERVRLLGGRFEIESKPGGPTLVRATIPRWQPLTGRESR